MLEVTFSRNAFFPLTRTCRNACSYCNFRKNTFELMKLNEVKKLAGEAFSLNCCEALLTFGERPDVYPAFRRELKKLGYSRFLDYVVDACRICLSEGLLPHTNAGVLFSDELKSLKRVNASMGLMLEQAVELECHFHSPGKDPEVRIRTIERAGKLRIPFTTGILLGIGEKEYDRFYSIELLADINDNYGHIQEVIIQPLVSGESGRKVELGDVKKIVEFAGKLFPHVQIPPNLFSLEEVIALIESGANDLGGISPLTPDHINPYNPWPEIEFLKRKLSVKNIFLRERLPIYDEFVEKGWYSDVIAELVEFWLRRILHAHST